MGRIAWKKEVSSLETLFYISSKKSWWLGSPRHAIFWKGFAMQVFLEGYMWSWHMGFDHSGQISGKKRPFILDQKRKHWAGSWISDLDESKESRGIDPEESDMAVWNGRQDHDWKRLFSVWKGGDWHSWIFIGIFAQEGHFLLGWPNKQMEWPSFPIWYEASCLNMQVNIALSWDHIKTKLRNGGFFRSSDHKFLTWRISDRIGWTPSVLRIYIGFFIWGSATV